MLSKRKLKHTEKKMSKQENSTKLFNIQCVIVTHSTRNIKAPVNECLMAALET